MDEKKRLTVLNVLSEPEQKKIMMVLDKIKLPPGYEFELDPAEASPVPVFEGACSAAQLAHVTCHKSDKLLNFLGSMFDHF